MKSAFCTSNQGYHDIEYVTYIIIYATEKFKSTVGPSISQTIVKYNCPQMDDFRALILLGSQCFIRRWIQVKQIYVILFLRWRRFFQ